MRRPAAWCVLVLAVLGCTRYGTQPASGPFARLTPGRTPPPPLGDGSLAATDPADGNGAVIPAGGRFADRRPLLPRRRPAAPGEPLPSPYARDAAPPQTQPVAPQAVPSDPVLGPPAAQASPAPLPPTASSPVPPPAEPATTTLPSPLQQARLIVEQARQRWAEIHTYEAIVLRRELAPNKRRTQDRVLTLYRKEPFAVYMRNLDEANAGRELLYNPKQHGDKIYAIVGKGDENLLYKAGQRAPAVSPDFPLVKQKSRHSIREAGLGTPIARLGQWLDKIEQGTLAATQLQVQSVIRRPEYPHPLAQIAIQFRPGEDPLLPAGGRRQWFFDTLPSSAAHDLPVLIIATEADGQEVEYYLVERFMPNVPLTDAEFDPDRLGGGPPRDGKRRK